MGSKTWASLLGSSAIRLVGLAVLGLWACGGDSFETAGQGQGGAAGQGGAGGKAGAGQAGKAGSSGASCSGCPKPANECFLSGCKEGVCTLTPAPLGAAISPGKQVAGDCQALSCDGKGGIQKSIDESDVPGDDGNECTKQSCEQGKPTFEIVPGAPCANGKKCDASGSCGKCTEGDTKCLGEKLVTCTGGQLVPTPCDGVCVAPGKCAQCAKASDCTGPLPECRAATCDGGVCGSKIAPAGTPCSVGLCSEGGSCAECSEGERRCGGDGVPQLCTGGVFAAQSPCATSCLDGVCLVDMGGAGGEAGSGQGGDSGQGGSGSGQGGEAGSGQGGAGQGGEAGAAGSGGSPPEPCNYTQAAFSVALPVSLGGTSPSAIVPVGFGGANARCIRVSVSATLPSLGVLPPKCDNLDLFYITTNDSTQGKNNLNLGRFFVDFLLSNAVCVQSGSAFISRRSQLLSPDTSPLASIKIPGGVEIVAEIDKRSLPHSVSISVDGQLAEKSNYLQDISSEGINVLLGTRPDAKSPYPNASIKDLNIELDLGTPPNQ